LLNAKGFQSLASTVRFILTRIFNRVTMPSQYQKIFCRLAKALAEPHKNLCRKNGLQALDFAGEHCRSDVRIQRILDAVKDIASRSIETGEMPWTTSRPHLPTSP